MINVAILGHGVVGSGVAEILLTHKDNLSKKAQDEINIKYILDLREFPESPLADRFTKDFNDILNDDEVSIVVEVLGGLNPAYEFVEKCLQKGKSVVTSNKELVAAKGATLLKIAQDKNVNFLFEASVAGGIPIIRPISQCLAANEVSQIAGILNGTTNFILTKMINEQMPFDVALKIAQDLGYAEKDPTADVEGYDAVRKICILASLTYGKHVYPDNIHTEGITKITLEDVEFADSYNSVIKLIGNVKMLENNKIDIFVSPMLVEKDSQLAGIDDVFNGVLVKGDATGDVVFYGKGAGKLPTASAVVADVLDSIKHTTVRRDIMWEDSVEDYVIDYKDSKASMYIRAISNDGNKAFDIVKENFGKVTKLTRKNMQENEIAFVTSEDTIKTILAKIEILKKENIEVLSTIRIGDL